MRQPYPTNVSYLPERWKLRIAAADRLRLGCGAPVVRFTPRARPTVHADLWRLSAASMALAFAAATASASLMFAAGAVALMPRVARVDERSIQEVSNGK